MKRERRPRVWRVQPSLWFSMCVLSALTWTVSARAQVGADREPADETQAAHVEPRAGEETEAPSPAQPSERASPATSGSEAPRAPLGGLDTTNINLSGAELDYEVVNDQLILKGHPSDLDLIEALISVLEETRETKELRVVKVTEKDANEIARSLEPELREIFYEPNQPEEDRISIAAVSSRIILVSALPDQIDIAVELIREVDEAEEDEIGKIEQLVFPVQHRKASDVAEQLKEIITKIREKQGARGAQGELQIIPNNANNSIMVLAPESEREKIQKLLNEIDVEPVAGWGDVKLTLFPLLHSKANDLANVIKDLLAQEQTREAAEEVIFRLQISKALPSGEIVDLSPIDLQKPTRIIPDDGTNSLIVATVEENVVPMQELIQLLDGVPAAEELGMKLFPLRFADADTVKTVLNEMFDQGKNLPEDPDGSGGDAVPEGDLGHGLAYNVGLSTDVRTNTLIVTGRPEQLQLAEMIVKELDRPATALKFPLRMIHLVHSDATRVGKIMTTLFDKRIEAVQATDAARIALERERVFISVDARGNSLIVSASEENYEEMVKIAKQLDARPARLFDEIRIIACRRMSAADLKQKIEDLWQRKADLRREQELPEDIPVVVADDRSNALIVASSIEDFEEIKQLVATLESQPLIDDMRLFKLEYADAVVLAGILEELFQGMEGQLETFKAPTVMPDPRSNALVVAGLRDTMERVEDVITRLDVKAGAMTAVFKVYPLEHGSSVKLQPRMQELFDSREQGEDIKRTPVLILADEASNTLVCSASRDDHEVIVDLLAKLDTPSSISKQFRIFPLKAAKVTQVADKLDQLFQAQAEGASGRADAIAMEMDERTNSLIVWASPSEMENICEIVQRLDMAAPAVKMAVRLIKLEQAIAEDFTERLTETVLGDDPGGDDERAVIVSFVQKLPDGREVTRELLRQDIHVSADPLTNSLLVLAPEESMNVLEVMIRDFDRRLDLEAGAKSPVFMVYPLKHASSAKLAPRMEELFESRTEGDDQARTPIVIQADESSNSLVCSASRDDQELIVDLLGKLDRPSSISRQFQIFPLKSARATRVAEKLDALFQSQAEGASGRADAIAVESDERTNSLIVWASPSEMQNIREVVQRLDASAPAIEMAVRVIKLEHAVAEDFTTRLTETVFGDDPGGDDERAVVLTFTEKLPDGREVTRKLLRQDIHVNADPLTNSLMVMAPEESMDVLEVMIRDFDQRLDLEAGAKAPVFMVYPLKHASSAKLAPRMGELFESRTEGDDQGRTPIVIQADESSNSLVCSASRDDHKLIADLLDKLDRPSSISKQFQIFPLKSARATQVAEKLDTLFQSQAEGASGRADAIAVESDERTNSLIVWASPSEMQNIREVVQRLDTSAPAIEMAVRVIKLEHAVAEDFTTRLTETVFGDDPGGDDERAVVLTFTEKLPDGREVTRRLLRQDIHVNADPLTNSLMVMAPAEGMDVLEVMIRDFDQRLDLEAGAKAPVFVVYPLQHASSAKLGPRMQELFDTRTEGDGQSRTPIVIQADESSNSLVCSASRDDHELIVDLLEKLDRPSSIAKQFRIFPLKAARATQVNEKLDALFQAQAEGATGRADAIAVEPDERTNSLIVWASPSEMENIGEMIERLDRLAPAVEMVVKVIRLEQAVAQDLLDRFTETVVGDDPGGDQERAVILSFMAKLPDGREVVRELLRQDIHIAADTRTNSLMVMAPADGMEVLEAMIHDFDKRLDAQIGPLTAVYKVYPLRHGSAVKLAPRMQELFDSRTQDADQSRTPVMVLADESSNSIVCSASRDDHAILEDMLGILDRPSSIAKQFRIFPLKMAKATPVAEKLEALFQSQAEGTSGRADVIAIEKDERTNSLIVWASPSEMENIAEVIKRLDTSAPVVEMMVRIIQLKQALAEDFAERFTQTVLGDDAGSDDERAVILSFTERLPDGSEVIHNLLRQDIHFEPDPRTNSLMVMAPAESMAMLEVMIRDFDKIRPIQSEIRLFPLVNSDAENMVEKLEGLFEPEGGGTEGETLRQFHFGEGFEDIEFASVGQELRFAADSRTNTLIAAGAEIDLRMVEELIRYLDSQEAEDRLVEVVHAKYRDAQDLATAVQGFTSQEQDVLGTGEDEESLQRRMERQVSIEAVGDEEEGSSSLILGTSRRMYQQTMEMIEELDRAEPQVMISVLIAEVTLSDSVELGIEVAGQDLHFSEDAILGPNGIIQGKGFDYVLGSDLGAAGLGLGGLNFTVTGEDFSFLLHALQQDSRIETLSRPILMVRNGEEGNIHIGDQVPYVESSRLSETGQTQSTIGREEIGVILTTTPHISPDGYVTIELKQELSGFTGENIQLTEGVSSPIITKREVETNVTVRDGETVVIGGLITARSSEAENKVPIMGDLPLIGALFRRTSVSEDKTELLVVLTVDILRSDEDRHRMSVEQRDVGVLGDAIRQNPLMEGLRILPRENGLGPVDQKAKPGEAVPVPQPRPHEHELYGPKPKVYGPVIRRPTTSAVMGPVYGPQVARSDARS